MTQVQKMALLYGVVITGAVLFLMIVTEGTPPGGIYLFSILCGIAGGATFALLGRMAGGGKE
ncbi:MAG: hypothetical protein AAGC81_17825 [Pseudomonadota bacterium]